MARHSALPAFLQKLTRPFAYHLLLLFLLLLLITILFIQYIRY